MCGASARGLPGSAGAVAGSPGLPACITVNSLGLASGVIRRPWTPLLFGLRGGGSHHRSQRLLPAQPQRDSPRHLLPPLEPGGGGVLGGCVQHPPHPAGLPPGSQDERPSVGHGVQGAAVAPAPEALMVVPLLPGSRVPGGAEGPGEEAEEGEEERGPEAAAGSGHLRGPEPSSQALGGRAGLGLLVQVRGPGGMQADGRGLRAQGPRGGGWSQPPQLCLAPGSAASAIGVSSDRSVVAGAWARPPLSLHLRSTRCR